MPAHSNPPLAKPSHPSGPAFDPGIPLAGDDDGLHAPEGAIPTAAANEPGNRAAEPPAPVEVPKRPAPVLLAHAGSRLLWVRAPDGSYEACNEREVFQPIERWHPRVPVWVASSIGSEWGPKRPSPRELFEANGERFGTLIYTYTEEPGFRPGAFAGAGTLIQRCARLDPECTPVEDPTVAEWLALLFGARLEKGLDWLATATLLQYPTTALYLEGLPGTGKTFLAVGLARMWGLGTTDYGDVIGKTFNDALLRSPILLCDEDAPVTSTKDGSAAFRRITANDTHRVEVKYQPVATLRGCPRLIVSANGPDALRIHENLNKASEDAIDRRILHVDVGAEAAVFLARLGGRTATADWLESNGRPGRLPRHIAWLVANRKVVRGARFLVESVSGDWLAKARLRPGVPQDLLVAIARLVVEGVAGPAVWATGGNVYVSVDGLQKAWCRVLSRPLAPTVETIGTALGLVSLPGAPARLPADVARCANGGKRPRVRVVAGATVCAAATEHGIGDEDVVRELLDREPSALCPPSVRGYPDTLNREWTD